MTTVSRTREDHMHHGDRQGILGDASDLRRRGAAMRARLRSRATLFSIVALLQLLTVFTFASALFAQELYWAKSSVATSNGVGGHGIAVDSLGNSYVTGSFSGTATFSSTPLVQLTGAGGSDVFIAKYDSNGSLLWAKSAGGTSVDRGHGIAVDSLGNSYVTGYFSGTATFSSTPLVQLTSTGVGNDVFIVKSEASDTFHNKISWLRSSYRCSLVAEYVRS